MEKYHIKKHAFYAAAVVAWLFLLWPYPVTTLMAACISCAFLPLYRRMLKRFPGKKGVTLYCLGFVSALLLPISLLISLVVPQATAGFKMLQVLRENNFQLPSHWVNFWKGIREKLSAIPGVDAMFQEIAHNVDALLSKALATLIGGGVSLVGSTLNGIWLLILFMSLSMLCTVYAERIFHVSAHVLRISEPMLVRFITVLRGALRGVLLGVVMVALCQGILCGIGFAMAGVKQPAFWGLLATLVAPIPVVGTAIVWLPLSVMLWFSGATMNAVGLFLWGTMAVGGIDNILRPLFLKKNINAPFVILILSIICGLTSFGPVGIIAGPLLVTFAMHAVYEADNLSV